MNDGVLRELCDHGLTRTAKWVASLGDAVSWSVPQDPDSFKPVARNCATGDYVCMSREHAAELLADNERLYQEVARLNAENARLRDDA